MKPVHFISNCALLGILALGGCAANSGSVTLDPVGPGRIPAHIGACPGVLKVYTATEEHNDGDVMFYPHTEYSIFDSNGHLVKCIPNHIGIHDEDPSSVTLPSGHYLILADSEADGRVKVPVMIGEGRTTVVNLEGHSRRSVDEINAADGVKTPSGQIIGWKAAS